MVQDDDEEAYLEVYDSGDEDGKSETAFGHWWEQEKDAFS